MTPRPESEYLAGAVRVQRRDAQLGAPTAVKFVVVLGGNVRDRSLAKGADESSGQGGLARSRVTDNTQDDRAPVLPDRMSTYHPALR